MFASSLLGYTLSAAAMTAVLTLGFILWVFVALWPATIARNKGYSFWLYFIVSLFFWWITLFVVMFLKDKTVPAARPVNPAE